MKTNFTVKNFRVFDKNGVMVELSPMTFLVGCNSSGKSSIVKSLIFLNEFLKGVRESSTQSEPRLAFDRYPLSLLGNFDSIINKEAGEIKQITLSFSVDSLYLGNGTTVELTFCTQENDIRREGFLKEVAIKNADSALLYHGTGYQGIKKFFPSKSNPEFPNLREIFLHSGDASAMNQISPLKTRYFVYYLVSHALDDYNRAETDNKIYGDTTDKEVADVANNVFDYFREIMEKTDRDMVFHAVDCYSKKRWTDLPNLFNADRNCVERAMQSDIITYLPILDKLDSISKENFETQFNALCDIDESSHDGLPIDYLKDLVSRIVFEFTNGDYSVFSDYYRSVENAFLEKGSMMVRGKGTMGHQLSIPDRMIFDQILQDAEAVVTFQSEDSSKEKEDTTFAQPAPSIKEKEAKQDSRVEVTLEELFYLLTSIKDRPNDNDYVIRFLDDTIGIESRDHRLLRDYMVFRRCALKDIFTIDPCNNLRYVGSNRIEIKRFYALENQDNFSRTVSEYFEACRLNKSNKYSSGEFINRWINRFGIGQRFSIESLTDGIGLVLKIYQEEDDNEGRILADYGYGISQLVSVMLEIETAILKAEKYLGSTVVDYDKKKIDLSNLFFDKDIYIAPITIAIEEPEIHLHPKYQSLLAEMFYEAYKEHNIQFIIETHSEYLLRKIQTLVGAKSLLPEEVSLVYVEDDEEVIKGTQKVRRIPVEEDGRLAATFGPGFYDEAGSLSRELLRLKLNQKE